MPRKSRAKSPRAKSPRAKSPSPIYPSPLIVTGKTDRGTPVTIFGEIHNLIDQSIYEALDLSYKSLWVEHSSIFCVLKPEDIPLFSNTKGSEWVWFTSKQMGRNVRCIDVRIENGFMSRLQEISLRDTLDTMFDNKDSFHKSIEQVLVCTANTLKAILSIKDIIKPIRSDIDPIIDRVKVLVKYILTNARQENITQDIYINANKLYDNLIRLGSMVIDAYILHSFNTYDDDQPIYLFVGLNHALRLAHWMKWKIHPNPTLDVNYYRENALLPLASYSNAE